MIKSIILSLVLIFSSLLFISCNSSENIELNGVYNGVMNGIDRNDAIWTFCGNRLTIDNGMKITKYMGPGGEHEHSPDIKEYTYTLKNDTLTLFDYPSGKKEGKSKLTIDEDKLYRTTGNRITIFEKE